MKRMYGLVSILTWILILSSTYSFAQSSTVSKDRVEDRIRQLESQMQIMQEELLKLKQMVNTSTDSSPTHEVVPVSAEAVTNSAEIIPAKMVTKGVEVSPTATSPQPQESKPTPKPIGVDLGPVRVVPYGTVYFNAFGNSGATNNADVPLFATPTGSTGGNVSATARQTRLGLKIEGPNVGEAKTSGLIEVDFYGGFPSIGTGEHFSVLRVRHAYGRLDWKTFSLEAGQDWMLFAPTNPTSLASVSIPGFAASGNPWARLPQIRAEKRWFDGALTLQGAMLAPNIGDYPGGAVATAPFVLQPLPGAGSGDVARMPFFQSRLVVSQKDWLGTKKAGSIGISGHYGRARVTNRNEVESTGVALDWSIPVITRLTWAGEAFFGRNLAGFQGGIFQNVNLNFARRVGNTLVAGGPRSIGTRGGWTQIGFMPPGQNSLTIYGGYGLDDPRDEDLISLVANPTARIRNQTFLGSFIHKLSPQVSWGLEYRRLETTYQVSRRQNNNHLNLGLALSF
jgi:hypothetical protein